MIKEIEQLRVMSPSLTRKDSLATRRRTKSLSIPQIQFSVSFFFSRDFCSILNENIVIFALHRCNFHTKEGHFFSAPVIGRHTLLFWLDAKRLIGRKFNEGTVQGDMKHWSFQVNQLSSRLNEPQILNKNDFNLLNACKNSLSLSGCRRWRKTKNSSWTQRRN